MSTRTSLALLVLIVLASAARADKFTQGTIDAALSQAKTLTGITADVDIKQSRNTNINALADTEAKAGGGSVITIYPNKFQGSGFPWLEGRNYEGAYAQGALLGTLMHELMHACMGDQTGTPGYGANSCKHLAIDYGCRNILCTRAQEIQEAACADPPDDDAYAELIAICSEIERLRERWNTPNNGQRALDCINGDGNPNFDPGAAGCGTEYPPDPGDSWPTQQDEDGNDMTDDEGNPIPDVIPACEACECVSDDLKKTAVKD